MELEECVRRIAEISATGNADKNLIIALKDELKAVAEEYRDFQAIAQIESAFMGELRRSP